MLYQPREEGQGLVEYALILVLVAVVVIVPSSFSIEGKKILAFSMTVFFSTPQ